MNKKVTRLSNQKYYDYKKTRFSIMYYDSDQ